MKEKCIYINGKDFIYNDESEDISYDIIQPLTEIEAVEILEKTKYLFDNIGLPFYLGFGTLLGAIRENRIIPGDEDVDVFINDEQKLIENIPWLYENGLKLCRYTKGILYSFKIKDRAYIDIYILREFNLSIWSYRCFCLSGLATPKKYFKDYVEIEFYNKKYLCPSNPEKLLEFWYGKNWRTPIKGHKFYYEVKSAYFWHNCIRPRLANLVKKLIFYKYWHKS